MQARFLSLNHSQETGYLVDRDTYYRSGIKSAVDWASKYQTYDDGITQHAEQDPLVLNDLEDFLASLAIYLLEGSPDREEHLALIERCWPKNYSLNNQRILFLAGLRPKEGKTTYFCLTDNKVSNADSKKHDKRWIEVPDWADGSPGTVYRLAFQTDGSDFRDALTRYALYDEIRDFLSQIFGIWGKHPVSWLLGNEDNHDRINLHFSQAFESVDLLIKAARTAESARLSLECYLSNTKSKREPAEEQAA